MNLFRGVSLVQLSQEKVLLVSNSNQSLQIRSLNLSGKIPTILDQKTIITTTSACMKRSNHSGYLISVILSKKAKA